MYEQNMLLDNKVADAAELKNIEKDIRKEVQDALKKAKVTAFYSAIYTAMLQRIVNAAECSMYMWTYKLVLAYRIIS
jgi:TPP-dependent pyruvate/acetoin dehydrogenase alpha subunit